MRRIFTNRKALRRRRLAFATALICAACATGALSPQARRVLGTLFASSAVAEQADAARQEAPAKDADTKAVFTADPLESVTLSLRRRERELERRERALAEEEARLETLRKEIEQNLAESEKMLRAMERLAGDAQDSRQQEMTKWVKIYQAMKPKQAGPVLAGLDPTFALAILAQMTPEDAGKILNYMEPEQAITLGEALALRHP
jgi:flagellar motility protein MotE (MotC chaperone)